MVPKQVLRYNRGGRRDFPDALGKLLPVPASEFSFSSCYLPVVS